MMRPARAAKMGVPLGRAKSQRVVVGNVVVAECAAKALINANGGDVEWHTVDAVHRRIRTDLPEQPPGDIHALVQTVFTRVQLWAR